MHQDFLFYYSAFSERTHQLVVFLAASWGFDSPNVHALRSSPSWAFILVPTSRQHKTLTYTACDDYKRRRRGYRNECYHFPAGSAASCQSGRLHLSCVAENPRVPPPRPRRVVGERAAGRAAYTSTHRRAYLSTGVTRCMTPVLWRGSTGVILARLDRGYARCWIRTSENSSSRNVGE